MAVESTPLGDLSVIDMEDIERHLMHTQWNGWLSGRSEDDEMLGTSLGRKAAKILVPGDSLQTDEMGLIVTDSFACDPGDKGFYGFVAQDPDNNTETVESGGLTVQGYRGEGMRSSTEGNYEDMTGEYQTAVKFDTYEEASKIELNTMGIGFVEMSTSTERGYHTYPLLFNYAEIASEPALRASPDLVDITDFTREFFIESPLYYSEGEAAALKYKFGYDPTVIPEGTTSPTNSTIQNAIAESISSITKLLNSSYPNNVATFPRTPPLTLSQNDISAIQNPETEEVGSLGQNTEQRMSATMAAMMTSDSY